MNRPELGHKFSCVGCGARFYDLNRTPAVCPKCEAQQPAEKPRVARAASVSPFGRRIGVRQPPMLVQDEPEPVADVDDEEAEADDAEDADDDVNEADSDVDHLPDIGERAL